MPMIEYHVQMHGFCDCSDEAGVMELVYEPDADAYRAYVKRHRKTIEALDFDFEAFDEDPRKYIDEYVSLENEAVYGPLALAFDVMTSEDKRLVDPLKLELFDDDAMTTTLGVRARAFFPWEMRAFVRNHREPDLSKMVVDEALKRHLSLLLGLTGDEVAAHIGDLDLYRTE